MERFEALVKRFHALAGKTGITKSTSYSVNFNHDLHQGIKVQLQTYDLPCDWQKYTHLGPFETYEELLLEFEAALILMESEV